MKNKGFWATLLVLSLALCLWGYFHPYARLGFSLLPLILCCNYKTLKAEWRKGIPKWILIPWLILLLSALGHLAYGRVLTDAMGLLLVAISLGVYLLARTMSSELRVRFAWLAIAGSIALIINRTYDSVTWHPGFLGLFHSASFAILIGMVLAPSRLRFWTALFGIPAVIISGSEEGIAALAVLALYYLFSRKLSRQMLVPIGAVCLIAIPLVTTGYLGEIYPRLAPDRFTLDMQTLTHMRWDAYVDLAKNPQVWIPGNGWYWDSQGSWESWEIHFTPLWKTVHNAPMRIAAQLGLLAGLSWLFVFLASLWKSKLRAAFLVILCFAFLDHFMWTSGIMWCWAILGICFAVEADHEHGLRSVNTG